MIVRGFFGPENIAGRPAGFFARARDLAMRMRFSLTLCVGDHDSRNALHLQGIEPVILALPPGPAEGQTRRTT
jgi:hypothetical protein